MEFFFKYRDLKGKARLDKVAADYRLMTRLLTPISNRQSLALFRAFDFLEFMPGIQLLTRQVIDRPVMIEQIMKLIQSQQLSHTAMEFGRMYYLITGKDLPNIDKNDFAFSLRDYLDYKPEIIERKIKYGIIVDLNLLQLADLDGLQNIPHLNNIESLDLSKNDLTEIPDLHLLGFNNLERLYLQQNHLSQLPPSCFIGLNNLSILDLSFNQIVQLPATIFQGLNKLETLNLQYNHLAELPSIIFKDLSSLQRLRLNHNQLTRLPDHLFDSLNNMQELDLEDNELTSLSSLLFKNVRNLRQVSLFNNKPLSKVPASIFQNLTRLQEVDLRINRLSQEDKQALRKAYPSVDIK